MNLVQVALQAFGRRGCVDVATCLLHDFLYHVELDDLADVSLIVRALEDKVLATVGQLQVLK